MLDFLLFGDSLFIIPPIYKYQNMPYHLTIGRVQNIWTSSDDKKYLPESILLPIIIDANI
jgi:hypothetical protein